MSHLAKIVAVKEQLIKGGITNPTKQAAIVRTAYVRALYIFHRAHFGRPHQCRAFNEYILNYWNETSPIQGNLILAMYQSFEGRMNTALLTVGKTMKVDVEITPCEEAGDLNYVELPGYQELVDTLLGECNHKKPQYESMFGEDDV